MIRYARHMESGELWAVELLQGWIPDRAAGPLTVAQLVVEPEQCFAAMEAVSAADWNGADLVFLCEAERQRLIGRESRGLTLVSVDDPVAGEIVPTVHHVMTSEQDNG